MRQRRKAARKHYRPLSVTVTVNDGRTSAGGRRGTSAATEGASWHASYAGQTPWPHSTPPATHPRPTRRRICAGVDRRRQIQRSKSRTSRQPPVGGRALGEILVPSWRHIGDTLRSSVAYMSRRGANCVADGSTMGALRQRIASGRAGYRTDFRRPRMHLRAEVSRN